MSEVTARERAARIFMKAESYIRSYGWKVEGMGKYGQPRCSMGALVSAYPKSTREDSLASVMYQALYKKLRGMTLTRFNHKFRDANKVAQLFERTVMKLKS